MYGVSGCTGGSEPRRAWTRRGTRSARCASRRTQARLEELRRQAGWARTFGLPIELVDGTREAQDRFPLMTNGRRPGGRLAADGRLARSVGARVRAGRGRTGGVACGSCPHHTGHGDRGARRPGHRCRRWSARAAPSPSRPMWWSTPVVSTAPEIGAPGRCHRAPDPDGAPVPAHRRPSRASRRTCRSCAIRTTSSTSARRSAACAWVATSATRRHGASTAFRPTSTTGCWDPDWTRFQPIMEGAIRRVPDDRERRGSRGSSTAPRPSPRTTSSSWARARCAGSSSPRASLAHGIAARAASVARSPTGSWRGSPSWTCGGWISGASGPRTDSREHTLARAPRELRDVLRHPLSPTRSDSPDGPSRLSPAYSRLVDPGCRVRGEVRLGAARTGSSPTRSDAGSPMALSFELLPAARLGGPAMVVRRSAQEALATRQTAAPVRQELVRQDRGGRTGGGRGRMQYLCAERRGPPGRLRDLHAVAQPARRPRVRPHRHANRARPSSCS